MCYVVAAAPQASALDPQQHLIMTPFFLSLNVQERSMWAQTVHPSALARRTWNVCVYDMCTANPMASIESFNEKVEVILEFFLGSNNISSDLKLQALVPWGVQFVIIWSVRRKREEICIFTCCFGAQKQQSCLKVLSTPKVTGTFWTNFMILRDMTCG